MYILVIVTFVFGLPFDHSHLNELETIAPRSAGFPRASRQQGTFSLLLWPIWRVLHSTLIPCHLFLAQFSSKRHDVEAEPLVRRQRGMSKERPDGQPNRGYSTMGPVTAISKDSRRTRIGNLRCLSVPDSRWPFRFVFAHTADMSSYP